MGKKIQNEVDLDESFQWGSGKEVDLIRTMNSDDLSASVQQMLKGQNLKEGVWVFGYGSLMWNPDFKLADKRTGIVSGYHRRLCLKSIVYRGTPDYHGLVFGLDKGGSCQGMAYRIATENIHSELQIIWEREMFAETYIPTWVSVKSDWETVSAITFVINQEHEHYLPDLELEEIAERVVKAEGTCGTCHDYVQNTVKSLHQLGLRDPTLEQLLTLIEYPQISVNRK
ncbi:MAG: Glutathione-specific gamma-glutamylcyclotransferase [Deltaproteobacteria bacterium]|jgi:cation transport protein ChaC|nr:Glutathione-specific gamma-glutamylcyclotransferase [Deltaproteobacteria bacterium]